MQKVCIHIQLNKKKIFTFSLSLDIITKSINNAYTDIYAIYSPLNVACIDIFVDDAEIDDEHMMLYMKTIVYPKLQQIDICGVKGIKNMFFKKDNDGKWFIITEGTNLVTLLSQSFI